MKKLFLTKMMLLLCALIVGSGSVWADYETVTTFSSATVVTNTGYQSYENDDWTLTFGGNNISMGTNKNKAGSCRISSNYGTGASTSNIATAAISKNKIDKISQITFVHTAGSGNSGKIYFAYSTDGSTWNAITLTSGTQGASTPAANTTMTVQFAEINSAYYAVILDKGDATAANFRFDNVSITFDKEIISSPLASISVDASGATTTFHQNDAFTSEGIVVTATYEDNSSQEVTGFTVSDPDMTITGTKTITVSYTENDVTKTDTYNITVNAPATLTSISLSGTYPNEFTQGDTFSSEGIVVTANYDDSTTKDVTGEATFTGYDMSTVGEQTVTVSYGGKTATYGITVNAYVQPTDVTINMNYEWLGSDNGSNLDAKKLPVVKEEDNITITITDGTSTHPRGDSDYIRVYVGSTITFDAPAGYAITSLAFTTGGKNTWSAPNVNTGTLSDKTWSGTAASVTFTLTGSCFIASVAVTLSNHASVALGTNGYSTFACAAPLDLANLPTGLKAYKAVVDGNVVKFTNEFNQTVPANTGMMLEGTASETYQIPVATAGTDVNGNDFLVNAEGTTFDAETGYNYFGLKKNTLIFGVFNPEEVAIPGDKAYLRVAESLARELVCVFDGDVTAIENVKNQTVTEDAYYNLAGQRVTQPTKGMYIVNGKKYIKH